MSLASQITLLAGAVRDKLNTMSPRLLPTGGTAGQVLVKNSATANDVTWGTAPVADPIDLTSTDPAAPVGANTVRLFRRSIAGRPQLTQLTSAGLETPVQASLARNKVGLWLPPGNAVTVPAVVGFNTVTVIGTATARNVATTNLFTRQRRLGFVSGATAGSLCGSRIAVAQATTGTLAGAIPVGGFFKLIRFGISDAAAVAGARMFVGIGNATAPTNVEPSTLLNCIGIGHGAADTNLKIFYGGSAAQVPIDLGANFPINTLSADLYELVLYCPAGSTTITWQVTRVNTGQTASGILGGVNGTVTPLPATLLSISQNWRCNNLTAAAVGLDIVSDYFECD